MSFRFPTSSLVPPNMVLESVVEEGDGRSVTAHARATTGACPLCGSESRRVHSRYLRHVADLPCVGRKVRLRVVARRFVCEPPLCPRRIFAERSGENILASRSRRTTRLECIVHHAWFELTRVQRRAPPAAQIMYDMEDELEQLQRESADLVIALQSLSAIISLAEATAKLDVVARVIDPDEYSYAHAALVGTFADWSALLQRCSLPGTQ